MVDLTHECLEQMDNLILQSSKGIHLLFKKQDIIDAFNGEDRQETDDIGRLRKIQEILYKFISLKECSEKQDFLKSLKREDYSLLIRAYFKIVENSIFIKNKTRH